MRKKKQNNFFIIILLLCLITVGFATLSTTLSINGITKIKGNTWDVYFENIQVKDGSVEADVPSISNKTKVDFEVQLDKPGDFYEFNVDVKNNGTIDAMIESITKSSLTSGQSVYLDYNVTGISEKALLKATGKKTVTVKVSFKNVDSTQLPSVTEPINLSFSFNTVQADSTAVQDVSIEDLDNDGKTSVGDLVTVGTERFYVISNNDGEVRALAEWNLLVGNQDDGSSTTPLANPTGLQDSSAKGFHYAEGTTTVEYPSIGTTRFSISFYWGGTEGVTIDLTNSANLINGYLINYKNSLKELGLDTKEVTLITKGELETLGCSSSSYTCKTGAPSWVYQTTYWSRSAGYTYSVWSVDSDGDFSGNHYGNYSIGVRPVISFLESEI